MNNCFLDANICISFVQNPHQFHDRAVSTLEHIIKLRFTPVVSPLVLDEFIYIIKRDYGSKSLVNTKDRLSELLSIPNLMIVNPSPEPKQQVKILDLVAKYNLKPRDAYHLMTMQTNKIKYFATFDNDFSKVFKGRVLKPLISPPQSPS